MYTRYVRVNNIKPLETISQRIQKSIIEKNSAAVAYPEWGIRFPCSRRSGSFKPIASDIRLQLKGFPEDILRECGPLPFECRN